MLSRRDDGKSKHSLMSSSYHSVVFALMFFFCILEFCRCLVLDLCAFQAWYVGYNFGLRTCFCFHWSSTTFCPDWLPALVLRRRVSHLPLWRVKQHPTIKEHRSKFTLHNNYVEKEAACVKPDRDGMWAVIPRPCASPSKEEARGGYYHFCLFAGETTEVICQAQDWERQSSRPIQRGIAAPEGALAPVEKGEFQTQWETQN